MTALKKYTRLESNGLWRDSPLAQRREVIVAFREATLVLSDPKSGSAVSHWSLPAIERLNPGENPALFAPGAEAIETLELDDRDMISALETVRSSLAGQRPKPGRLRGFLLGSGTFLVLGLGIFWLPDTLMKHTASVLPAATRAAIGQAAMADVQRLTGSPCTSPLGSFALTDLADKLFGPHRAQILILREGVTRSAHLPGGTILIGRKIVEDEGGPDLLAGLALTERLQAELRDPILPVLKHAGLTATFRLLTSGALPDSALTGYGEVLLQDKGVAVPEDVALARFKSAGVSSTPYAYAIDPSGESTIGLIEADPLAGLVPEPLMADGEWVSLQDICSTN
ncbi:MAG: hypothetical protein U0934_11940 [Pseudotabrizicola sp.]|uniref:hypothetical protein n=1 Tax=Pseudotabrizicola sp. TaxID=2939647 RepID=UPI00271B8431|nr:hypothetical protein [Pseudotabrizicola sp.]MDO8882058.1 hypothetical protein [Pseudotabrizicola sp.]MDP2080766.1 hypothetical protein [Pseudotabrizicola sp.]MDZ7574648.1 hypothetical protein [Pseudotabrizicola sp.]